MFLYVHDSDWRYISHFDLTRPFLIVRYFSRLLKPRRPRIVYYIADNC